MHTGGGRPVPDHLVLGVEVLGLGTIDANGRTGVDRQAELGGGCGGIGQDTPERGIVPPRGQEQFRLLLHEQLFVLDCHGEFSSR
ncbi:hypothetical protein, partial [Frankia sp. Cr1]|uniref:hypothetical protein n=1 Tax=Frankia sp. Cr1 TaxID=3073931 RepID=UPI002AD428CF